MAAQTVVQEKHILKFNHRCLLASFFKKLFFASLPTSWQRFDFQKAKLSCLETMLQKHSIICLFPNLVPVCAAQFSNMNICRSSQLEASFVIATVYSTVTILYHNSMLKASSIKIQTKIITLKTWICNIFLMILTFFLCFRIIADHSLKHIVMKFVAGCSWKVSIWTKYILSKHVLVKCSDERASDQNSLLQFPLSLCQHISKNSNTILNTGVCN